MKSEIVDVNETRRDLTVEVPSTVVDEAIGHAAAKLGRQARIPGFRPGKVPATVVRQRFRGQIMQDVAEYLVAQAVGEALTERGVEPIDTPDIQDLVLEEGKALTFKASFDVVPGFDPGDLASIEATAPAVRSQTKPWRRRSSGCANARRATKPVETGAVEAGHTVVVALERQGTSKEADRRAKPKSTSRSRSSSARRRTLRASIPR